MSKFRELFEAVLENFCAGKDTLLEATPVDFLAGAVKAKMKTKWPRLKIEDQEKKGHSHQNGETVSKYIYVTSLQTYELAQFKNNYIVPAITFPVTVKMRCSNHDKFNDAKDIKVYIPNPNVFKPTKVMKDGLKCYEMNDHTIEEYSRQGISDVETALNVQYRKILGKLNQITGKMLTDIWHQNDTYLLNNYGILYDFLDDKQEFKPYFLEWMNAIKEKGIQKRQISRDYER